MNIKFGLCGDYANLAMFAMRAAGIPVGIEIVPYWGRGNGRHTFNVVYDSDSTFHDFSGAEQNPDEHLIRFRHEMPKVYRQTFGKQPSSLAMQCGNEDVPDFFKNPCLEDVTGNYPFIEARDITVPVEGHSDRKFAYLCVYHPTQWIPVAWGRRQGDSVRFQNVCPNIVYHPALYADGKLQLTGHPFLLDTLGCVNVLAPQTDTVNCVLSTLYKDAPKLIKLLPTFVGGKIQGANRPDFSDAVTYYTFTEQPTFKYTTVDCRNTKPCKYLRYLSSDRGTGNMADVEFYAEGSDVPLKGKVIGHYKPSLQFFDSGAEAMFDGDPTTFFHTADTLSWGGLELEKPAAVSRIRFIIRSENNGIRKGSEYELFYMDRDKWVSLGSQVATEDDRLEYKGVPKNALFRWIDHTKDNSKRIFIIENKRKFGIKTMETLRTSSYIIPVKLESEEGKYMLIHGYTGAMDIVSESVVLCLKYNEIKKLSDLTLQALQRRGYITNKTKEEEIEYVERVAQALHKRDEILHKSFTWVVTYNCNFRCPYCFEKENIRIRHIALYLQNLK